MRRITFITVLGASALIILSLLPAASAKTIHVRAGDSIQSGVRRANPGDRVLVDPGTYRERTRPCPFEPDHTCAVVVKKDDIRLVGKNGKRQVVLKARGDQDDGIGVGTTLDPACLTHRSLRLHTSLIKRIQVRGFADDGAFLACVDDWRITRVRAIDNREYGLFPSHSVDGRIDHSLAKGANDTGFYIGQSRDGRMDHNKATDNVSGFEIENSSDVRADHNVGRGNTAGILSFALPNLDVKSNSDNRIDHNKLAKNNRKNTCLDPDDAVCAVPPGTGVLLLAADDNRVHHNNVRQNKSFGIAVANYCVSLGLTPAECAALDINPDPDQNRVVWNKAKGNGYAPDPSLPPVFAVDLAWDLNGTGNCWSKNEAATTFPSPLPSC